MNYGYGIEIEGYNYLYWLNEYLKLKKNHECINEIKYRCKD